MKRRIVEELYQNYTRKKGEPWYPSPVCNFFFRKSDSSLRFTYSDSERIFSFFSLVDSESLRWFRFEEWQTG